MRTMRITPAGKVLSFGMKYLQALAACVYLFSVGVFLPKRRSFIGTIAEHFGYGKNTKGPSLLLPAVNFSDFAPEEFPIVVSELSVADGNVSLFELIVINTLVRKFSPKSCLEIGTFDGRTTLNLAANTSPEAKIHTLDLPPGARSNAHFALKGDDKFVGKQEVGWRYKGKSYEEKVVQHYGDSATFDFRPFYGTIDFVFIDGAHSYEHARHDSQTALLLIRRPGVIMWHDYGVWPGVTQALNELYLQAPAFRGLRRINSTTLAYLLVGL